MGQLIPFRDSHTCVFGRTRSGKTYGALKSLQALKAGVLFFNPQLSPDVPRSWTDVDSADDFDDVKQLLAEGRKVNYLPSYTGYVRDAEFAAIVGELYDGVTRDIYIVADECHLYEKRAKKALVQLATTGLRFGLKTVFISQRPAEMEYTLMTQSTLFAVYALSTFENDYFKQKGFPLAEIQKRLTQGGEHAYVLLDDTTDTPLSGPFKV